MCDKLSVARRCEESCGVRTQFVESTQNSTHLQPTNNGGRLHGRDQRPIRSERTFKSANKDGCRRRSPGCFWCPESRSGTTEQWLEKASNASMSTTHADTKSSRGLNKLAK